MGRDVEAVTEPQFTVPLSALVTFELLSEELFGWECRESFCGMGGYPTESAARAAAVEHLAEVHGIRAAGGETS